MIVDILSQGPIASQDELIRSLARRGVDATQATVSRDLRELGVAKGPRGYVVIPGMTPPQDETSASLGRSLRSFVIRAQLGGTLVVLKTGPGQAQSVAVELDRTPPAGVLGTVAGDDTIFIATKSAARASSLLRTVKKLAGLA